MSGLFGTLNIGRSGLTVSQTTVDVTSHNIANVNTDGYSRQRAEIVTARPSSSYRYGQVGTGAQVEAIERIRDKFLDYQYRNQNSVLGSADIKNDVLYQIETVFNEPTDTGISTVIGKMFDAWQELSKTPNSSNLRTVVVQQSLTLTDAINSTYKSLDDIQTNCQSLLKNNAIDTNSILDQITKLNDQIRGVTASGQNPNDLMDQRDKLLDELSYKFDIRVENTAYNGINVSAVDKNGMVTSTLVSSDGTGIAARLSYISSIEETTKGSGVYEITYYRNGNSTDPSMKDTIKVAGLSEEDIHQLQNNRIIWGDSEGYACKADGSRINTIVDASQLHSFIQTTGEIAGNQSVQTDIEEYKESLDKLAFAMAIAINAIHSGSTDADKDSLPFFVNSDYASYNTDGSLSASYLADNSGYENKITASNITVNKDLLTNVMKINVQSTQDSGEGDGKRALAIAQLRDALMNIQDVGITINSRTNLKFEAGSDMKLQNDTSGTTIDDYFKDMVDKLGVQAQEAGRLVDNQNTMLVEVSNSRSSVSGVSLDEEMSNLIQYQHAYSANAKIISTVDELLDVVINGLKR